MMKTNWILGVLVGIITAGAGAILLSGIGCGQPDSGDREATTTATVGEYRISQPVRHENLTLFMVHGPSRVEGEDFMTLQEAIDANVVTVHETGQVSELSIQNTGNRPIYVQAGEIVKGGKQDRTIQQDLVVPGQSGRMPLKSFCVEQGRWAKRGGETANKFSSANNMLATKELKLAALKTGNQREVWREVARTQRKLSASTNENVAANRSATSLELSMENEKLVKLVEEYVAALADAPEGKKDVIGLGIAVNGEVMSVDIYAAEKLFRKVYPKLLRAAAMEAIAKKQANKRFASLAAGDVAEFMAEMDAERVSEKRSVSKSDEMLFRENKAGLLYDHNSNGQLLHRSYIQKDEMDKQDVSKQRDLGNSSQMLLRESGLLYDHNSNGQLLHRSYIQKDEMDKQDVSKQRDLGNSSQMLLRESTDGVSYDHESNE
jgi:hypothetical protein